MDILLNKGSLKSCFTLSVPTLLYVKEIFSNEDEEVNEEEERLTWFGIPPIFDNYGDDEMLGLEKYGNGKLLGFGELEGALNPSASIEQVRTSL